MLALSETSYGGIKRLQPLSLIPLLWFLPLAAHTAESVDTGLEDAFLAPLVETLSSEFEVVTNLNARNIARRRPDKPRLGGYSDLPVGSFPSSLDILSWESAYQAQEIRAIAVQPCKLCDIEAEAGRFLEEWLETGTEDRIFITYQRDAQEAVGSLLSTLRNAGFSTINLLDAELSIAGELYATAGRRLGVDTREARALKSEVPEISFLGERVRRNSHSIFRETNRVYGRGVASNEPAAFIKESLGDESTGSTIREIVVPGGVALGETARLNLGIDSVEYDETGLVLVSAQQNRWRLPALDAPALKSLFDFVERSSQIRSDAIVDIDGEGRVRISSPLRDTDTGYEIMHADTQPFEYVRNLDVTKSVIIDTFVKWLEVGESELGFETEYEVRFLSADNMRIAQTRAALVYEYDSQTGASVYHDSWGRLAGRLNEKVDMAGLGDSLVNVADYSGWIALFRWLKENNVEFVIGRYQFMKIDSKGRKTPARY